MPTDLLELFSSPVQVTQLTGVSELNASLVASLVEESTREPGIARSNLGGWHSTPDLAHRDAPDVMRLMSTLAEEVSAGVQRLSSRRGDGRPPAHRLGIQAWAMVMRAGDYTRRGATMRTTRTRATRRTASWRCASGRAAPVTSTSHPAIVDSW